MIKIKLVRLVPFVLGVLFSVGCNSFQDVKFDSPAYRPSDPSNVSVKVSLNNASIYVMEGDKPLLVTATCIGKNDSPTPLGEFRAFNRLPRKRSNTYGFHVRGNEIIPGRRVETPKGYKYVGYPMPYWVEFKSGYGFHAGYVHPIPRTHGCLRIHNNVAPKFFELVRAGTPIFIANSFPEDTNIGKNLRRPQDYKDPDPARSYLVSGGFFDDLDTNENLFEKEPK
tara:strand:+ start:1050 stop:1724 length:675 start_codon:yes stop_codon:yes gene_type:complete